MTTVRRPRVAITVGDPAGIGPEIAAHAAEDPRVLGACEPIIYAPPQSARFTPGELSADAGRAAYDCIVRAVNDTWDNDTAAAIVGAAVGALHGRRALPERWVAGLLGRTAADDDGEVFRLTEAAVERWVG